MGNVYQDVASDEESRHDADLEAVFDSRLFAARSHAIASDKGSRRMDTSPSDNRKLPHHYRCKDRSAIVNILVILPVCQSYILFFCISINRSVLSQNVCISICYCFEIAMQKNILE